MKFNLESATGIDLGHNRLVLSSVVRGIRGLRVGPSLIVDDFRQMEPSELHDRVQDYVNSNHVSTENVIVGLSRDQVAIKQVELPLEVEENLAQVVQFQVNKLEPADDVQVCFDFQVLERDEKAKRISLQILMAPRKTVDEITGLLGDLGLQPVSMRLSSTGLHQLLRFQDGGIPERPAIILRFEQDTLEATLIQGPSRHFCRYQPLNGSGDRTEVVGSTLADLLSQVDLAGFDQVHEIYLAGSGAEEALEPVRERFGSARLLSDGLKLAFDGAAPSSLSITGPSVGLALSSLMRNPFSKLNLIPPELRRSGARLSYIPTLVLAALLIFLVGLSASREYLQQKQLLNGISARAAELAPRAASVIQIRDEAGQLSRVADEMSAMLSGRQRALSVLKELTELIPDDAYLQSIRIELDKVSMTGFSDTANGLIPILQGANCLTNVESKYITQDRRSGKDKFSFEANVAECASVRP